jgi:hypothetical protein
MRVGWSFLRVLIGVAAGPSVRWTADMAAQRRGSGRGEAATE